MNNKLKLFRDNFISGALVLIPVTAIVWLLVFLINIIGGVRNILPSSISDSSNPFVRLLASIFVLAVILIFIVVVGWVSRKFMGQQLLSFVESLIDKIPVLRSMYKAMKQLIDIFSGKNNQFKAVCLVKFPHAGALSYAFITGEKEMNGKKYFYVFVPTTPNPTSGFTVMFEQDEVVRVNTSVEEAFKTIITMGVLSPKQSKQ